MAGKRNGLNDKQRVFIHEYLVDRNGKQAAIRAGYAPKNAEITASKLLRLTKVRKAVDAVIEKRTKKIDITAEKVLQEIASIAMDTVKEGGFVSTGDKLKALDQLGKHLKLFTDKVEIGGSLLETLVDMANRNE